MQENSCPIVFTSVKNDARFAALGKLPGGKLAQALLLRIDCGMTEGEFESWKSTFDFPKALAALQVENPEISEDLLRDYAHFRRCYNYFADELPWNDILDCYPCLQNFSKKHDQKLCEVCGFCGMDRGEILQNILYRADYRRQSGGFYADRLLTAILLDVPLEKIERCRMINVNAALRVLGVDRSWLEEQERIRIAGESAPHPHAKSEHPTLTPPPAKS